MSRVLTVAALGAAILLVQPGGAAALEYEHRDTRELVRLVRDAAELVGAKGSEAFRELAVPGSRWRRGERYVFVMDPRGNMLVHPDASLRGKNVLDLKDIQGRPIIRGLIAAATSAPDRPEGWHHYQWFVPGEIVPRWKSSFVRLVEAPSGERYVVGSGVYDDRMERAFVVDMVGRAVARVEAEGEAAFARLHDPTGEFMVKDAYVFVIDPEGLELVNPAFPNLEGRNVLDLKDTRGKPLVREMLEVARRRGAGWVDYMWPRPGDSVSTQKSTYVSRARLGDRWVMVAAGVYLPGAPTEAIRREAMRAPQLMAHVREGAALLEEQGERAFPRFRERGSRWFRDDTYFFVWTLDGKRVFHAADPAGEGQDVRDLKDVHGRPWGKMMLEVGASPSGEGWVHYVHVRAGELFPRWKSTFLKRVTLPSGQQVLLGCGVYDMAMDRVLIEDLVDRAARLVEEKGRLAFDELRDRRGPFVFMDTYVFVTAPDGTELVNPAQPSVEGRNLIDLRDLKGKALAREYIGVALARGRGWVEYYWYKPGEHTPVRKVTFVRRVKSGGRTYVVGSGLYPD